MVNMNRRQAWSQRIAQQSTSGLSIRSWCEREGVAQASFFYWRKCLSTADRPTELIALPIEPEVCAEAVEIRTPGGYVVRVFSAAQCKVLAALLGVVP